LLFFDNPGWLIPALFSYPVLAIFIYHGNKHVILVPWSKSEIRGDQAQPVLY